MPSSAAWSRAECSRHRESTPCGGGRPAAISSHEPSPLGRPRTGEIVMSEPSIKVGVIAEQTGPLSVMGLANANVARMVIDDINARGGLLGRQVDLCLEDGATI